MHLLTIEDTRRYLETSPDLAPQFPFLKPGKQPGFYVNPVTNKEFRAFGSPGKTYQRESQAAFDLLKLGCRQHFASPFLITTRSYRDFAFKSYENSLRDCLDDRRLKRIFTELLAELDDPEALLFLEHYRENRERFIGGSGAPNMFVKDIASNLGDPQP